jgi:hypothetical protein
LKYGGENMADKYTNTNIDVAGQENLTKFETFFTNRYVDPFVTGHSFVFLTRPSLFILPYEDSTPGLNQLAFENMKKDPVFSQFLLTDSANPNDNILAQQLSFINSYTRFITRPKTNFLPIFTNRVKNFQPIDVSMEQREAYETKQGYKIPLPYTKTVSEASNSLILSCQETSNLDFFKIMTLWVNYISNITDGTFYANPEMVRKGIIDYMGSIYYFVLEPDGRTVKYWAKYTGVWPTVVPSSQLSYTRGESSLVESDMTFSYTVKEEMNPSILEDFNKVSLLMPDHKEVRPLGYTSIRKSQYLNKTSLKTLVQQNNGLRGPLVYFDELKDTSGKFILSFNEREFFDIYTRGKFNSEYFFNLDDFTMDPSEKEEGNNKAKSIRTAQFPELGENKEW